ncbi:dUTPase [Wolbachia endosymbiont strain TRS of Brugia malayi]|uniref:Deoxyuridine 5'-triphosphate nucleotidohydrolase n=1 Tax=Wolbachia sp. subsp. Brugia malayi (strain TRS) TaxID=292805 RepID=DUT_WOLTR|nr:RecName: Full=Deoxyuridine 5'-triphosphate nucleotidohydrolase; Short=dUTPase; AltName: Full=dUTP pyrophosphatase [Wolbachia endosymbiont strain TRS of Brugia malayi]AAW70943.1 dUTPase [Wolbachia endosymbiont strain TRS of Brugia malayi]
MGRIQRNKIKVEIKKLSHGKDLPLPCYATMQSAGMDLYAALGNSIVLNPLERLLIPTGIVIVIPNGFEGQIRPRSGLAAKYGITVLNSPGTIDSDYRGEVKVCLINLSNQPYEIKRGDRIAQILIAPVFRVIWDDAERLCTEETERSAGGFGSSGR